MERPTPDFEALRAALATQARSAAGEGPQPEPEELLDYLVGRLPPETEASVRRRVVADPEAAGALLDLAELERAGEAASADRSSAQPLPADFAVAAGWRELQGRLRRDRGGRRWLAPLLSSLAAASLLLSVGLGLRVQELQRERDRPVANPRVLELPAATRGADQEIALAPGEWLLLTVEPEDRCDAYEAEIAGPAANDRRIVPPLHRDEFGRVNVVLPSPQPGRYSLRLGGCASSRETVERFFRIIRPARGVPPSDGR